MPSTTAAAETSAAVDHEVSNLSRAATDARHQFATGDDRSSDARADEAAEKVLDSLSGAKRQLAGRGDLHIIAQGRGHFESFAQGLRDRQIDHGLTEVRGAQKHPL